MPVIGPYALQAAIASVHARAAGTSSTDWNRIVALYDVLMQAAPSPVIELNRAVAIAMRDGPAAGLQLIDEIHRRGELLDYHLSYAAHADLCRRLSRNEDAHGLQAGDRALQPGAGAPVSGNTARRGELSHELFFHPDVERRSAGSTTGQRRRSWAFNWRNR